MANHKTHFWFKGIALAPDGRELILEYSDPDQGGTQLSFRYVISLKTSPRLVSGYTAEGSCFESAIACDQIPYDIFRDAHEWLESQIVTGGNEKLLKILTKYLELLKEHEVRPPNDYD